MASGRAADRQPSGKRMSYIRDSEDTHTPIMMNVVYKKARNQINNYHLFAKVSAEARALQAFY